MILMINFIAEQKSALVVYYKPILKLVFLIDSRFDFIFR